MNISTFNRCEGHTATASLLKSSVPDTDPVDRYLIGLKDPDP
jgi:hypothetical protein